MSTFKSYNLPQELLDILDKNNFTTPTPIQEQTLTLTLAGKDLLGSAKTGTGKTIAFALPVLTKLLASASEYAVIISPTRELASQIQKSILQLINRDMNISTTLLIGGEHIGRQLRQLSFNPRIIVGTPGRIQDHINRGTLPVDKATILVLDETDRMLDMGFEPQIRDIVGRISTDRQTMLFSATFPPHIEKLASKYLKTPERVFIGDTTKASENITQEAITVDQNDKEEVLLKYLQENDGSTIVFTKTKFGADKVSRFLRSQKVKSEALHGNLRHKKRESLVTLFRKQKYRVLVATDIAARGLDIPHIATVINYDIPQSAEDYIHRIGRTGRAGAQGKALCYITPREKKQWSSITRVLNRKENDPYTDSNERRSFSSPRGGGGGRRSFGGGDRSFGGRSSSGRSDRSSGSSRWSDRSDRSSGSDKWSDRSGSDRPRRSFGGGNNSGGGDYSGKRSYRGGSNSSNSRSSY